MLFTINQQPRDKAAVLLGLLGFIFGILINVIWPREIIPYQQWIVVIFLVVFFAVIGYSMKIKTLSVGVNVLSVNQPESQGLSKHHIISSTIVSVWVMVVTYIISLFFLRLPSLGCDFAKHQCLSPSYLTETKIISFVLGVVVGILVYKLFHKRKLDMIGVIVVIVAVLFFASLFAGLLVGQIPPIYYLIY